MAQLPNPTIIPNQEFGIPQHEIQNRIRELEQQGWTCHTFERCRVNHRWFGANQKVCSRDSICFPPK